MRKELKEKLFELWLSPLNFSPDCIFFRQQSGTRVNLQETQTCNGW